MADESKIRDYFSENLHMIEDELTLIDKEYYLPNAEGASGKVDILAKDRFGHYVIIEIKKSDKTAREALHELYKYIALMRLESGFDFDKPHWEYFYHQSKEMILNTNISKHLIDEFFNLNEKGRGGRV